MFGSVRSRSRCLNGHRGMCRSRPWLLATVLLCYPTWTWAVGLGEIKLYSALNQPLKAEITLDEIGDLQAGDLRVGLATAEDFNRAGVERVFFLNDLRFTPLLRGNNSVIRVESSKPVNEPYLHFLVEADRTNGRLLREYTILLDPPGAVPSGFPEVAQAPAPHVVAPKPQRPRPAPVAPKAPVTATAAAHRPELAPPASTAESLPANPEQLPAMAPTPDPLQAKVNDLQARLHAQDEQIASSQKQLLDLQAQLGRLKAAPAAPAVPPTAPVPAAGEGANWPLWLLIALAVLLAVALVIRRHRQRAQEAPAVVTPAVEQPLARPVPVAAASPAGATPAPSQPASDAPSSAFVARQESTESQDALEGVSIYIAYGRFSEAASILRAALLKEPERSELSLRLLEVLGHQGDSEEYRVEEQKLLDAGYSAQELRLLRASYPKLTPGQAPVPAPVSAPVPTAAALATVAALAEARQVATQPETTPLTPSQPGEDELLLDLDDLSLEAWDELNPPAAIGSESSGIFDMPEEQILSDLGELPDLAEPQHCTEDEDWDDDFLDHFSDPLEELEIEPSSNDFERLDPASSPSRRDESDRR